MTREQQDELEDLYLTHTEACEYTKDYEVTFTHMATFERMIPVVYDTLKLEAERVGKNFEEMLLRSPALVNVTKSVVVDVLMRYIAASQTQEPMTQIAQSAGGFSASGTLLVPGGGLYIKRSELARLGLRRQQVGGIDFYGFSD